MKGTLCSYDPSNGELVGELAVTEINEIDEIVCSAHLASKSWRKLSPHDRVQIIERAYHELESKADELSKLISREMGKDIGRSRREVGWAVSGGSRISRNVMEAIKDQDLGNNAKVEYRPLGVAAVISPWNYPLAVANNLIVPALVAGNAVVFKPSEETTIVSKAFANLLNNVLPENLLQIVIGDGEQGEALVNSDVNIIAFTGSQATGKKIMKVASTDLKRLIMELGGNDPMIVMEDANLELAAQFAVSGSFENAGQMCVSTERIYVDKNIAEQFEQMVVQIASTYKVGPWDLPDVNIGPMVNRRQHSIVIDHLVDAKERGARFLLGSDEHTPPYINPTVIADITPEMKIEREETFGPVVAISRYNDVNEAIRRSNDSDYGLGAVVFGQENAREVASQLEAGMIGINQGVGASGDTPWVGAKQSGFGFHGSVEGHRQFTRPTVVSY